MSKQNTGFKKVLLRPVAVVGGTPTTPRHSIPVPPTTAVDNDWIIRGNTKSDKGVGFQRFEKFVKPQPRDPALLNNQSLEIHQFKKYVYVKEKPKKPTKFDTDRSLHITDMLVPYKKTNEGFLNRFRKIIPKNDLKDFESTNKAQRIRANYRVDKFYDDSVVLFADVYILVGHHYNDTWFDFVKMSGIYCQIHENLDHANGTITWFKRGHHLIDWFLDDKFEKFLRENPHMQGYITKADIAAVAIQFTKFKRQRPSNLVIKNTTGPERYMIHRGDQRITDQCAVQFIMDATHHYQTVRKTFSKLNRPSIITQMKAMRYDFDENDIIIEDVINWCESNKIGLVLIWPDYTKFVDKRDKTNDFSIYGYVNDGHISVITNEDMQEKIQRNGELKVIQCKWDKPHEYLMIGGNIDEVCDQLIDFQSNSPEDSKKDYVAIIHRCTITMEYMKEHNDPIFQMFGESEYIERIKPKDIVNGSIHDLVDLLYKRTNYMIENVVGNRSHQIVRFSYRNILVEVHEEALYSELICNTMEQKFKNQSMVDLASDFIKYNHPIPQNRLNHEIWEQFNAYGAKQLNTVLENVEVGEVTEVRDELTNPVLSYPTYDELDLSKAYTSAFLNTDITRYFYDEFRTITPTKVTCLDDIKPGHYWIKHFNHHVLEREGVQIVNSNLLAKFHDLGAIDLNNVYAHVSPSGYLEKEIFHKLRDKFYELPITEECMKSMINKYIGCMGILTRVETKLSCTTDFNTVICMYTNDVITNFKKEGDIYLMMNTGAEKPAYDTQIVLNNDIKHEHLYRMLFLSSQIQKLDVKIYGYKVDAIYTEPCDGIIEAIDNPWIYKAGGAPVLKFPPIVCAVERKPWGIIKHIRHDTSLVRHLSTFMEYCTALRFVQYPTNPVDDEFDDFIWTQPNKMIGGNLSTGGPPAVLQFRNWNIIDDLVSFITNSSESLLITGLAGTGKSHTLIHEIVPRLDKFEVWSPTHQSCSNLKSKGLTCETVDKRLHKAEVESYTTWLKKLKSSLSDKTIVIDEAGMVSSENFIKLDKLKRSGANFRLICIGDFNQLFNPEMKLDISNSYLLKDLLDYNKLELTTIHRYDDALSAQNQNVLLNGTLTGYTKYISSSPIENHICYTHATRIKVNAEMMNKFKPNNAELLNMEKHDNHGQSDTKPQPIYLYSGLPIICLINNKKKELPYYNRQRLTVVDYLADNITVKATDGTVSIISKSIFHKYFRVAYCNTVHSIQSMTIEGLICIHDIRLMHRNMVYTAISRATSLANIYVDTNSSSITGIKIREDEPMVDYDKKIKGYIYHLIHNDKPFYVGQTTTWGLLKFREKKHYEVFNERYPGFIMTSVIEVKGTMCIDEEERKEIKKQKDNGYELENIRLMKEEEETLRLTKAVTQVRPTRSGCVVDKGDNRYRVQYYVNGKREEKCFRYVDVIHRKDQRTKDQAKVEADKFLAQLQ